MVNCFRYAVFIGSFWCVTIGFAQEEMLLSMDAKDNNPSLQETNSLTTTTLSPSVTTDESAQLLQFEPQNKQASPDPYPLTNYKGSFLKEDLSAIRSEFIVKNIQKIKATLERWRQRQDGTFPVEGYLMLATIYDQLQVYPQALSTLEDGSIKTKEADKKVFFLLAKARVLRHSGEFQKSLDLLNQIPPKQRTIYPDFFFDRGLSFLYLNNYDQTIIHFRKYLGLVPDGEQSSNIRRAVAWLLLARRGQIPSGGTGGSSSKERDLEKMVQILVEKQVANDLGDLSQSATATVDDKSLNLIEKDLEDLEQYSNIAD